MAEDIEGALLEFGLTHSEVRVYLANLRLGPARVEEIAKKGGVLRTTCYDILKALVAKGFAAYVIKAGVKYYNATEPRRLLGILEERKRRLGVVMESLEAMRASVPAKPNVEMFEGKEGLRQG
jgi:sugar-specific transcriptional regulator TrmB